MPEILERLKETSDTCLECYEVWSKDNKDSKSRESLQEAVHELRKVASRLEIEMAISERNGSTDKKLPIPTHRSQTKNDGVNESILPERDDNNNGGGKPRGGARKSRPRRPAPKKDA